MIRMKGKKVVLAVAVIVTTAAGSSIFAAPTVIQDSRIRDTLATPVLGRGYSIGSNTFQSTCLENVVLTEPSYDFTYKFTSMEDTTKKRATTSGDTKEAAGPGTETSKKLGSWAWKGWGQWSGSSEYREIIRKQQNKVGKKTTVDTVDLYSHVITVSIDIYSYYASVDEAKSKMSQSASQLLLNNDIPGFFNSCGPYYVRSIGRKATFLSFFEYKTEKRNSDSEFEGKLETQIKSFRAYTSKWKYGNRAAGEYNREWQTGQKTESEKLSEKFQEEVASKHLSITTLAFGLGKNEKASIISYDLETFKAAIKDAFMSMQNPRTGKVSSIEVVPWVENTQFQNLISLSQDTFSVYKKPDGTEEKRKMSLFEKKQILNSNAEFLIEIERADRNLMNMYYKSKLCRKNIRYNWYVKNEDGTISDQIHKDFQNRLVINNNNPNETLKLTTLNEIVSQANIDKILKTERSFMYGDSTKKFTIQTLNGSKEVAYEGAAKCINEMMKLGIFGKSYREIESCIPVTRWMGEYQNEIIDKYCLPKLVEPEGEAQGQ